MIDYQREKLLVKTLVVITVLTTVPLHGIVALLIAWYANKIIEYKEYVRKLDIISKLEKEANDN